MTVVEIILNTKDREEQSLDYIHSSLKINSLIMWGLPVITFLGI